MAQKRKIQNSFSENLFIVTLIGGLIGLAISISLILLSPLVIIKTQNPNSFSSIIVWVALFIGGFVSSFIIATRFPTIPLKSSLLVGGFILLLLLPFSFFVKGEFDIFSALITLLVIFGSAFLGGFAVYRLNNDQKRNMKKALKRR